MIEAELLKASPLLRKKMAELKCLERQVRIRLLYEDLRIQGKHYNLALRLVVSRFNVSLSTVKRAMKRTAPPPWKRRGRAG